MPINALEIELAKVQAQQSSMPRFLRLFIESDIAIPSGDEVMPDGSGFRPLLFHKEGVPMVACFTAPERIGRFADTAPYCLVTNCREFLRRVPAGYGLVLNPGQTVGFDIGPDGLREIVADFG